eukprot:749748-Hanusia_phi.AAC.1
MVVVVVRSRTGGKEGTGNGIARGEEGGKTWIKRAEGKERRGKKISRIRTARNLPTSIYEHSRCILKPAAQALYHGREGKKGIGGRGRGSELGEGRQ